MLPSEEAWRILNTAEQVCSAVFISESIQRLAAEITAELAHREPVIVSVMGGAVVFTGHLLPQLNFPASFDYIHVSRYGHEEAGAALHWKVLPTQSLKGKTVLVLDDILDEGITLAAIRDKVMQLGAAHFYSAVLADKEIGKRKPIRCDFIGFKVPDRFVFGFGMDIRGAWRNLPAIYAKSSDVDS